MQVVETVFRERHCGVLQEAALSLGVSTTVFEVKESWWEVHFDILSFTGVYMVSYVRQMCDGFAIPLHSLFSGNLLSKRFIR